MHENANITFQQQETNKIVQTVLSIQPRESGGAAGHSPEAIVEELASDILARLPKVLSVDEARPELLKTDDEGLLASLSVVLLQEMDRFNRLLTTMRKTLIEINKAIKGEVVMSLDLDRMYTSLLNNQVPRLWERVAYPSLKPLGSWVLDLIKRVEFMRVWLTDGEPTAFWMSGFFFPQGFMTARYRHARKTQIPIDRAPCPLFSSTIVDTNPCLLVFHAGLTLASRLCARI